MNKNSKHLSIPPFSKKQRLTLSKRKSNPKEKENQISSSDLSTPHYNIVSSTNDTAIIQESDQIIGFTSSNCIVTFSQSNSSGSTLKFYLFSSTSSSSSSPTSMVGNGFMPCTQKPFKTVIFPFYTFSFVLVDARRMTLWAFDQERTKIYKIGYTKTYHVYCEYIVPIKHMDMGCLNPETGTIYVPILTSSSSSSSKSTSTQQHILIDDDIVEKEKEEKKYYQIVIIRKDATQYTPWFNNTTVELVRDRIIRAITISHSSKMLFLFTESVHANFPGQFQAEVFIFPLLAKPLNYISSIPLIDLFSIESVIFIKENLLMISSKDESTLAQKISLWEIVGAFISQTVEWYSSPPPSSSSSSSSSSISSSSFSWNGIIQIIPNLTLSFSMTNFLLVNLRHPSFLKKCFLETRYDLFSSSSSYSTSSPTLTVTLNDMDVTFCNTSSLSSSSVPSSEIIIISDDILPQDQDQLESTDQHHQQEEEKEKEIDEPLPIVEKEKEEEESINPPVLLPPSPLPLPPSIEEEEKEKPVDDDNSTIEEKESEEEKELTNVLSSIPLPPLSPSPISSLPLANIINPNNIDILSFLPQDDEPAPTPTSTPVVEEQLSVTTPFSVNSVSFPLFPSLQLPPSPPLTTSTTIEEEEKESLDPKKSFVGLLQTSFDTLKDNLEKLPLCSSSSSSSSPSIIQQDIPSSLLNNNNKNKRFRSAQSSLHQSTPSTLVVPPHLLVSKDIRVVLPPSSSPPFPTSSKISCIPSLDMEPTSSLTDDNEKEDEHVDEEWITKELVTPAILPSPFSSPSSSPPSSSPTTTKIVTSTISSLLSSSLPSTMTLHTYPKFDVLLSMTNNNDDSTNKNFYSPSSLSIGNTSSTLSQEILSYHIQHSNGDEDLGLFPRTDKQIDEPISFSSSSNLMSNDDASFLSIFPSL